MAMKILSALLISACLISCEQNKISNTADIREDTGQDRLSNLGGDTLKNDRWHFNKYLNDNNTPQLAKDVFNNNWKLKDDEPLEFLAKLHGQEKEARPFYFRVVTNSYKQADGAYAEGLGGAGYNYVKNHPGEFSSYFFGQDGFTDEDLQTWADIVMLEFGILSENEYQKPLMKNYIDCVRKNCKGCSKHQTEVLDRLSRYLKERWSELLKHIDK